MGDTDAAAAIRYATAADAPELSRLAARTFRATYLEANDRPLVEAYVAEHYSAAIQSAELQDERLTYLVADIEGRLGGFALLRTDQSHPDVIGSDPIRLARIYVDAPHLGRGLGSALMDRCLAECRARGHDVLWLGVWERNTKALGFYERWGFARVGTELFDVGGDQQRDAILALPIR
jgi:GNAT superfamily N-acetyltransferase